ncbi:superoxide dismutase [Paenibacillus darwinianus]|uniref:superoxide dismutase n=1 Tax=Paenibacillus darwinianus TaxID=1380763 RepID=A0A9W5W816_9BACL|nr:Fe-Mn family superoxide dismutase [Paenibacillus darwinianus]EXX87869.1 superoxide dismutase [Paenibacillus darwinianus]EXX90532.1 superoxide dismutase [Paenibacillus darwinianus]EXX90564.1 superoxide dismutase [Paenibacillus darwinianus]
MLFVDGPYVQLRLLEELQSWKKREKEHAAVLRAISPGSDPGFVRTLEEWESVFADTERCAEWWLNASLERPGLLPASAGPQLAALVHAARAQSEAFVRQLHDYRTHSADLRAAPVTSVIIGLMLRESQYLLDRSVGFDALQGERGEARARPPAAVPVGGHVLPPLPYPYNGLEPYIDQATMRIHHDKHHQSYVDGLNRAETALAEARKSGDLGLVKHWERELAFNGAGHYLHTIFWEAMKPHGSGGGGEPSGAMAEAIRTDFDSFEAFKRQFSQAAEKVESGGWAILVWSPRSGRLEILQAEKHQNLSQWDVIPLLPLVVWEHAYYLKHQNRRADYIKDWWNVVNWPYVSGRYAAAVKLRWNPL